MKKVYLVKLTDEQGDWWLEDRSEFRFFSDSHRDARVFRDRDAAEEAKEMIVLRSVPGHRRVRVVPFRAEG